MFYINEKNADLLRKLKLRFKIWISSKTSSLAVVYHEHHNDKKLTKVFPNLDCFLQIFKLIKLCPEVNIHILVYIFQLNKLDRYEKAVANLQKALSENTNLPEQSDSMVSCHEF